MRGDDFESGFRSRMFGVGGSVARARAARVSWMRFTHINCTGVRTDCSWELEAAETKASVTLVTVTVI